MYFLNYWGTLIGGLKGIWVFEIMGMAASVTVAYRLCRKFIGRWMSVFVLLCVFAYIYTYMGGDNYTEEYALPFQIIALYIFMDYFFHPEGYGACPPDRGEKHSSILLIGGKWFNLGVFLCGVCFSAVFLLRQNMISVWLVFCPMVLIRCLYRKEYQELGKFVISFLAGAVLFALPFMIYLLWHHAFQDFIHQYFTFNFAYVSAETRATLVTRSKAALFFFSTTAASVSCGVTIWKILRAKDPEERFFHWAYLGYLLVTLALISISGQTYGHYGLTLIPAYIYPFAVLCKELCDKSVIESKVTVMVVTVLVLNLVIPSWIWLAGKPAKSIWKYYIKDDKGWYESEVVKYIRSHTDESDRISVFGNYNTIYLYSERLSASKYSYQFPIMEVDPHISEEYYADLSANLPKMIVMAYAIDDKMGDFLESHHYALALDGGQPVYELQEGY